MDGKNAEMSEEAVVYPGRRRKEYLYDAYGEIMYVMIP